MTLDKADNSTISCFWDAAIQGTQARQLARGVTTWGMRGRQHGKGRQQWEVDSNAREATAVASSLSMRRALIVILLVINNFF